jgi:hypothetical protein
MESGYTKGFFVMAGTMVLAAAVALIIPRIGRDEIEAHLVGEPEHPELGMLAAGTLIGDKSE